VNVQTGGIRRALISVSDKRGLVELGRALARHDVQILSTGGSARMLRESGIPVVEVSDFTGFPEIMGGRVKTLHPRVHAGILARAGIDDDTARDHDLPPIDLVVVNLYPFAETAARPNCSLDEAIENIDIGGPAMLRAAAKNHARVTVVCNPGDYRGVTETLPAGPDAGARLALATTAFAHTANYDGQISQWLSGHGSDASLPSKLSLSLDRIEILRYGENPHQPAGLYAARGAEPSGLAGARPLQGKPLSYNNLLDADAAWRGVVSLGDSPACCIIKHTNPCGAARADSLADAYRKALAADPTSAFGGIIAFNRSLDAETAETVSGQFAEVVIAPDFEPGARRVLAGKKNLRLLAPSNSPVSSAGAEINLRRIDGGWLAQAPDNLLPGRANFEVVTERAPDEGEWCDLEFAWACVAMVRSNAIVLARDQATLGIGAGQMSRVDASRIAVMKAADRQFELAGACMASDAFFPFADGVETAAAAGVRAVIQPGGSKRDGEVIEAANRHGIAMVFTGRRHFRH